VPGIAHAFRCNSGSTEQQKSSGNEAVCGQFIAAAPGGLEKINPPLYRTSPLVTFCTGGSLAIQRGTGETTIVFIGVPRDKRTLIETALTPSTIISLFFFEKGRILN
jgi:hypothetical protein